MFENVYDESVKVYLHMYDGNVQQNLRWVESCVTKEFFMSPRFSSTIFDPDANSVLLRAHLCTVVTPCEENPVFEIFQESVKVCTTGMPCRTLHAQHPVSLRIFRCKFSALTSTPLYSSRHHAQKTLCSKFFKKA